MSNKFLLCEPQLVAVLLLLLLSLKHFILPYFVCTDGSLPPCISVLHKHAGTHSGQERAPDPLKQMSCHSRS